MEIYCRILIYTKKLAYKRFVCVSLCVFFYFPYVFMDIFTFLSVCAYASLFEEKQKQKTKKKQRNIRGFSQFLDISCNIPQFLGLFRCFSTFHPISHYFSDSFVVSRHFSQYLIFFRSGFTYYRHFALILIASRAFS